MRLSVLVIVAFLGYVQGLHFGNGTDFEDLYDKLLDKIINVLQNLVQRTDNPSDEDKDRVSCIYGLNALARNLGSPWGLAMLDSASKLQSGILNGNLVNLGQYDQCVEVSVEPTAESPHLPKFTGQHCLVRMNIFVPNGTIVVNGENQKLIDLFGNPFIPLTTAQCYPSLCKPWVLQEALNGVFSVPDKLLHFLGEDFSVNVTVDPLDCHVAEQPPYDAVDWVVLGFIIFFLVLGFVSSAVDYFYSHYNDDRRRDVNLKPYIPNTTMFIITANSNTMKLLCIFSFYSNSNKLFSLRMGGDSIPSLNGLKFISMCWVVLGHRYLYVTEEPLTNFIKIPDDLKRFMMMVILNGPMAVDTFFVISGMLNMYGFCITVEKTKRYTIIDLIKGYIHRYMRLTPAYLMMIGFTATWLYRLRDGPLWDRFVGDYKNSCRQTYWMNLVYLNNYLYPDDYCMMQSWYLAADMQLYWLSPFLMYPLWRWPKLGLVEFVLLVIASIVTPFLVSWYGHIAAPIPITSDHQRREREMAMLYFPSHTKSVSYVLGIGAGYLLYKYRQGKLRINLNIWMRAIGWTVSVALMLYAIFGGYYTFQMDYVYNQLFSAFFIGFQRFFWSTGLIWIIWMCVTGYGGIVNDFLSWKFFIPLGRVCYSVYLTHIVVLMCSIAALRNPINYNDFDQFEMYFGDLVMCLFSGLILTLLIEAPMLNLVKFILGGGGKKPPRPRTQPSQQSHLHVA